jgi:hypothetical protein
MPAQLNPLIKVELVIMLAHRNPGAHRCCTSFVSLVAADPTKIAIPKAPKDSENA